MGSKSDALATRFEGASHDLASKIQGLSDAQWRANTVEEGWTVAATAHHAADSTSGIAMMVQAAATGSEMPPLTMDGLHQMNADHAKEFANCSREETMALLRQNTGPAATMIRGLNDEQLVGKAMLPMGMEMTAEQIIENVLTGHIAAHRASIDTAALA